MDLSSETKRHKKRHSPPREETELSEKQILSQICPSNSFLKLVNRFIFPLFFSPRV